MKRGLLIIFLLMVSIVLKGQSVLWEKAYNLAYMDFADAIESTGQGSYMTLCSTHKYGLLNSYLGVAVLKLTSSGDTIFCKDLNVSVGTYNNISMSKDSLGYYWVSANGWYFDYLVHVLKLDSNGVVLAHYTIEEVSASAGVLYSSKIKVLPDGDLLIVGQTLGSSVSGMIHDSFVTRMSSTGTVKWTRYYNLGYYTEAYYVEGMANGHYWVSGSAYSDIWGMELDTSGNVVRQHIFYTRPTYAKIYNAYVQQLPNQKYLVIGANIFTNPYNHCYVGLYNKNYTKEWGHEEVGTIDDRAYVTSENKYVLGGGLLINGQPATTLRKYNADSSLVWNVVTATSSTGGYNFFTSIAFTGDGDAVFAGYIDRPYPALYDLYFMKVGGIGLPYLPETDSSWLVTSSKPIVKSSSKVSIYPNPARDVLHIDGSAVSGVMSVELQNVLGKVVYKGQMLESSTISLSGYARGLYLLRVRQGESLLLEQKVLINQ